MCAWEVNKENQSVLLAFFINQFLFVYFQTYFQILHIRLWLNSLGDGPFFRDFFLENEQGRTLNHYVSGRRRSQKLAHTSVCWIASWRNIFKNRSKFQKSQFISKFHHFLSFLAKIFVKRLILKIISVKPWNATHSFQVRTKCWFQNQSRCLLA